MMRIITLLKTSVVLLSVLILCTGCAGTTDPAEAYKGQTSDQIYRGGKTALIDKSYSDAIKHFEALDAQYPFSENSEHAQLYIIYAYYMSSDYASAAAAADRFIRSYPTAQHVDYAYYIRSLADYYQNLGFFERYFTTDLSKRDLSQIQKTFKDFALLIHQYPQSIYTPAAYQYLVYLRNIMAKHELQVAEDYYNHQAYLAAANRANEIIRHYQGAAVMPDALVVMIKSYRALGLTSLANSALAVLNVNYPHSTYINSVQNVAIR